VFPLIGKSGWLPDAKHRKKDFLFKMKNEKNIISNKAGLLGGKDILEFVHELDVIESRLGMELSSRIEKYMHQIPAYKFLSLKDWGDKKVYLLSEAMPRFRAFVLRKFSVNEFADFMVSKEEYLTSVWESFENNVNELHKIFDEILIRIDPKFEEVVQYKPTEYVNEEKEKIPTVKEFIMQYISDNSIQIESIDNKTKLEEKIHSAWCKQYPKHPRKLSSFHKDFPRKS